MLDLGILDTLIAMVIIILVLSLIVQSIQALIKKTFKLKSLSIRNSLQDLFETILPAQTAVTGGNSTAGGNNNSPTTNNTAQGLVKDVTTKLKEMGRKTLFGQAMLDSLAKDDLLKILTRLTAEHVLPGTVEKFQAVLVGVRTMKTEIGKINTELLQGDASAKFAAMQGSIMPLLDDLEALASGADLKKETVLFGDLFKLRQIKASDVLNILGQVQQTVSDDLSKAQQGNDQAQIELAKAHAGTDQGVIDAAENKAGVAKANLAAITAADKSLKEIATLISSLRTAFDSAFAPLVARLQQVEVWYETVMQGFEERYTRHMKSVAIAVSIVVVVLLNANFFTIYRAIKADPVRTSLIVQQAPAILKAAQQEKQTPTTAASPTPSPSPNATGAAQTTTSGEKKEGASQPQETPTTANDVKREADKVEGLIQTYESFGIKPLSRQQIKDAFAGQYRWRDLNETFVGWAIMVMLLSAGAPFWQDTLESLFGLKNVLRQKSNTKNVEEEKGGQPKP